MKRFVIFLLFIFPLLLNSQVRKTPTGIILSGSVPNVRAMEPLGGAPAREADFAAVVNEYHKALGNKVKIYCMIIPNSTAFYCPAEAKGWTRDAKKALAGLYSNLDKGVIPVEVYPALEAHKNENIYSRTDHHWAPLGAYYASEVLVRKAGVNFLPLSRYSAKKVKGYVGSMAAFSKDAGVKNSPEDFVYYVPEGVSYTVTMTPITKKGTQLIKGKPVPGKVFYQYPDGSKSAYCTFLQGDSKIVKIKTNTLNKRKLLILKDSYGNAVPGNLLGSFEEIHVIDFRYFPDKITDYVNEHGITDLAFVNNLVHANTVALSKAYRNFLK